MTPTFTGVLVTPKRKHLLVDNELRRTACRRLMYSGTRYTGLEQWNGNAPLQCPKCVEEWQEFKEISG